MRDYYTTWQGCTQAKPSYISSPHQEQSKSKYETDQRHAKLKKSGPRKGTGVLGQVEDCDCPHTDVGQGASPGEKGGQNSIKRGSIQSGIPKINHRPKT